ncbi:MAG TPA: methylmalonyl Co-A mutase-associated GTPase MeaB [Saprospiraceae bacterium]|nr:methylmalonyl Co-A mutase-associated GTPase MeaB [Saprospiraceae bacterium]
MKINTSYLPDDSFPEKTDEYFINGILAGNRYILSEAITLVESTQQDKRTRAIKILKAIRGLEPRSMRIAITGSPGAGKSTFLDTFGTMLTGLGHKVAVLAIDPSSQLSRGSILGDKTRMEKLSRDPLAFIRPTAAGQILGGIASGTKEVIDLCEAAGYEIIFVETVGVGQSETDIAHLTDLFCLLILPGAGDDIQGIKRGITEMADLVLINKSDGDRIMLAKETAKYFTMGLKLLHGRPSGIQTKVLTCSALTGSGLDKIWKEIRQTFEIMWENGWYLAHRQEQELLWFDRMHRQMILHHFLQKHSAFSYIENLRSDVINKKIPIYEALSQLIDSIKQLG